MSKITIHDYSVPKVTFEEADTIARNTFGHSMISPDFVEKVLLILEDDRAHVADLQDFWVEVPPGATIPKGVLHRVEWGDGDATERRGSVSVDALLAVGNPGVAGHFVRKSDLLKVVPAKTRRERIIDEMSAEFPRLGATFEAVLDASGTAEKWLTCYEAAVKVVDGDA